MMHRQIQKFSYGIFTPAIHEMADQAAAVALRYFRADLGLQDKDDKTPVTRADREIEERLRDYLRKHYPDHGVIGEEYGRDNPEAEFVWVIDPIDGTKAFATGKPLFGTIIGLTHNESPVAGLIDQAFTRERWLGIKGEGATHNNKPIKAAPPRPFDQVRFYTAAPEMFHGRDFENFETLRKSVKWALYGCDCYAYGLLGLGQIDLVMEQHLGLHDYIGLVPIVEEAGGHMCDWQGRSVTLKTGSQIIAASHADLARHVVKMMNHE